MIYRRRSRFAPAWTHTGFAGLGPSGGVGEAYTSFQARLNAFSQTVMGDGWCSNATDDDGRLLWATADGRCLWAGGDPSTDVFAAFAYDAVYALANAMHRTLLAAAPSASLDGVVLMDQLLNTRHLTARQAWSALTSTVTGTRASHTRCTTLQPRECRF